MRTPRLDSCGLVDLPKVHDLRGNLTFVQDADPIPFGIKRVYYVYDVPAGSERGGHAHKECFEFIVPVAGSFDVTLGDGNEKLTFTMNRPYQGLLVTPMIWRDLRNFSSGSVCLVLASQLFDEQDYYRDYSDYVTAVQKP